MNKKYFNARIHTVPNFPDMETKDVVAHIKHLHSRNERNTLYSKYVILMNMRPTVDNAEFLRIYDSVLPMSAHSAHISSFEKTHYDTVMGLPVNATDCNTYFNTVWPDGLTGSDPAEYFHERFKPICRCCYEQPVTEDGSKICDYCWLYGSTSLSAMGKEIGERKNESEMVVILAINFSSIQTGMRDTIVEISLFDVFVKMGKLGVLTQDVVDKILSDDKVIDAFHAAAKYSVEDVVYDAVDEAVYKLQEVAS